MSGMLPWKFVPALVQHMGNDIFRRKLMCGPRIFLHVPVPVSPPLRPNKSKARYSLLASVTAPYASMTNALNPPWRWLRFGKNIVNG